MAPKDRGERGKGEKRLREREQKKIPQSHVFVQISSGPFLAAPLLWIAKVKVKVTFCPILSCVFVREMSRE